MRVLASKALYNLVSLDPKYFLDTALPYLVSIVINNSAKTEKLKPFLIKVPHATSKDMQVSHGAMLAIAEIVLALYDTGNADIISAYYKDTASLATMVTNLPARSLTTFGSEHIREGACHLITSFSTTQLNPGTSLADWKQIIHTSLERKEENVQEYAVLSFGAVAKNFGISESEIDQALLKIDIHNPMLHARRGYTLALGTLDYTKYSSSLNGVLTQLCKATQFQVSTNISFF